jgi:hypothetical protein
MTSMQMAPVKSSNISAIGYDSATKELHVKFKSGETYAYSNVDEKAHAALVGATSIGGHLNKAIKSNHPARKLKPVGKA